MIVITMAGDGNRFKKLGYTTHKYNLILGEYTLLQRSLLTFKNYFNNETILFCYRQDQTSQSEIKSQAFSIGLTSKLQFHAFDKVTSGQAETAAKALRSDVTTLADPLFIFNIDSYYDQPLEKNIFRRTKNIIDIAQLSGDHWSFAKIDQSGAVVEVAEKRRISSWCSTGLYHFSSVETFLTAYHRCKYENEAEKYVMPLFQELIDTGASVYGRKLNSEHYHVAGTPDEYERLKARYDRTFT